MTDGTAQTFGVLANAWKETVRDAIADIAASRESAKVRVRRAIWAHTAVEAERKRLYTALRHDRWTSDRWLCRQMRKHWKRGRSRTRNQIIVRSDQYRAFTLGECADVWLAVPGLERRKTVKIPLNTTVVPTGTLRLIRASDPDIALWTPHTRVRQILQERTDRRRSRLPDQDSSIVHQCQCGERNIRTLSNGRLEGSRQE
jgi:hypothetical protein